MKIKQLLYEALTAFSFCTVQAWFHFTGFNILLMFLVFSVHTLEEYGFFCFIFCESYEREMDIDMM